MHPSPGNHPCLICGHATSQWCSRCQTTCVGCVSFSLTRHHLTHAQDWPRHREQCRPSPATLGYGVNMIATPPPEGPESISVSAILFVAEEGTCRAAFFHCVHHPSKKQITWGTCP
ncbi:hypothetical protein B0H11DRAFT_1692015, partial [Mycena galericulata]